MKKSNALKRKNNPRLLKDAGNKQKLNFDLENRNANPVRMPILHNLQIRGTKYFTKLTFLDFYISAFNFAHTWVLYNVQKN